MTKEQAIEILEGLKKSNEACIKSSKIEDTPFTTIWKRQNKSIETVLSMLEEQDKIIDLMAEKIYEEGIVWNNKEEVKQYFENKAKEVK